MAEEYVVSPTNLTILLTTSIPSNVADDEEKDIAEDGILGKYPKATLILAQCACVLIIILALVGNLLTVVALINAKRLWNATMPFVCNLCAVDVVFCTSVLPLLLVRYVTHQWSLWGGIVCHLYPFFLYGLVGTAICNLTGITCTQYVQVLHPHRASTIFTTPRLVIMLLLSWIIPFSLLLLPLTGLWGSLGYDPTAFSCTFVGRGGKSYRQFLHLVGFLLPSIIIIACYTRIFIAFNRSRSRLKTKMMKPPPSTKTNSKKLVPKEEGLACTDENRLQVPQTTIIPSTGSLTTPPSSIQVLGDTQITNISCDIMVEELVDLTENNKRKSHGQKPKLKRAVGGSARRRYDVHLAVTMLTTFLAFVVAFMPFTIATTANKRVSVEQPTLYVICAILTWSNCCLNPIIYVILNRRFRHAYASLLTCGRRKDSSFRGARYTVGGRDRGGEVTCRVPLTPILTTPAPLPEGCV